MVVGHGALENLVMEFWRGKRVLVTGHTGFKGAWLSLWLSKLGAKVAGVALEPETSPSLFDKAGVGQEIEHNVLDIRDGAGVTAAMSRIAPEIVFHLAAQALVRRSYRAPVDTWSTNVLGTLNVLEAARSFGAPCALVVATTDKVYENTGSNAGYRETDRLGGHDPYSASKAAVEIAVESWRRSFLGDKSSVRVATARAGNVIGGGDWCEDRIVPDIVRALSAGSPIPVRNPNATRPWQHVLEPLQGYMKLAERLTGSDAGQDFAEAFNFGPTDESERPVREVVDEALRHWPGSWVDVSACGQPHEADRLILSTELARTRLNWRSVWDFRRTMSETIQWYREAEGGSVEEIRALTLRNIERYEASLAKDAK